MEGVPILEGANLFFWIVCGLIGLITAITVVDSAFGNDKKKEDKAH